MLASKKEISDAVKQYFREKGYTQKKIAEICGKNTRSGIAESINSGEFSKKLAVLFAEKFGFQENFLLFGYGDLFEKPYPVIARKEVSDSLLWFISRIQPELPTLAVLPEDMAEQAMIQIAREKFEIKTR